MIPDDFVWQIDLGGGYKASWMGWHPDRDLNPQYDDVEDVEHYCLLVLHKDPRDGTWHESAITIDSPSAQRLEPGKPKWTLHSESPLHVEPSILCTESKGGCGAHGFIREGKWVDA